MEVKLILFLDSTATAQKNSIFFSVVSPVTYALSPAAESINIATSTVVGLTAVVSQISDVVVTGAVDVISLLVNESNQIVQPLADGTADATVGAVSSLLDANEQPDTGKEGRKEGRKDPP